LQRPDVLLQTGNGRRRKIRENAANEHFGERQIGVVAQRIASDEHEPSEADSKADRLKETGLVDLRNVQQYGSGFVVGRQRIDDAVVIGRGR